MRNIINGFAVAAALIATPALAETKPGTAVPVAATMPDGTATLVKDKRYCVVGTVTGSRLPKKTCMTRAEWMDQQGFDPLAPQK